MKINEEQLKQIIRESLNEFRGGLSYNDYDGDNHYVRPNGQRYISNDNFKTMYNNSSYGEKSGKRAIERGTDRFPNMFSYGKGNLCSKLISELKKIFQVECTGYNAKQTGKINWTENELKLISDIHNNLMQLARLSKTEGAKTRGQVPNVAESKLNDVIKESLKKVLNEAFEYDIAVNNENDETRDLYFKLDDPYDAEKLIRQIQGELENNLCNIDGVFELEPVDEKHYEYRIPNLSYDEYETVCDYLYDAYHDEIIIED